MQVDFPFTILHGANQARPKIMGGTSRRKFIFVLFINKRYSILKQTQIFNMQTNINLWYIVNACNFENNFFFKQKIFV
jgi:hypothetical protein